MQIQISWLFQKPTDLDLHCLRRQGISGFSRTRVKEEVTKTVYLVKRTWKPTVSMFRQTLKLNIWHMSTVMHHYRIHYHQCMISQRENGPFCRIRTEQPQATRRIRSLITAFCAAQQSSIKGFWKQARKSLIRLSELYKGPFFMSLCIIYIQYTGFPYYNITCIIYVHFPSWALNVETNVVSTCFNVYDN